MLLAEQLVGEARERRAREMDVRERSVDGASAFAFLGVAVAIALTIPSDRALDPILLAGLVAGYAVVSRVRFEFAEAYVSAEQLVFVAMLMLLPVQYVPLLVTAGAILSLLPDFKDGTWHPQRWISAISHCWAAIGPVLVIGILAPGTPTLADTGIYVLAFAAQLVLDFAWAIGRDRLLDPLPVKELALNYWRASRVEAILSPLAFVIGMVALDEPTALLVIGPLVWLLSVFSHDRQERYTATLELNRAYRGTVMLLADVVEFDDNYTAHHSRSVVDLVQAVAEELDIDQARRQELEFAALLHDVGKISIPKEILNKPAKLTQEEFELMKTHTIEGQFMLDRVGGLLANVGEIVRSCHERWDGTGYPDGLAREEIPLEARIVFACDAYNAMTTNRPYRAAMPAQEALAELEANTGTQFDANVVAAVVKVIQQGEPEGRSTDHVRALIASVQVPERVGATG
jgi:HD-GYP domain-containing protein (c-di-GMP phosphodiesterase class II)